ncbi:hypothetical protein NEOLEDRAFT_195584 [Neolentinus lepideus HHB14362 ss-1]|uniref:Mitochondrial K+-H+ exchange-related-domain-containing protein n=1 Tax=Neolentinus lepideus HHB14362 ss-1 TaxID=1314782 RepID=A0A165MEY5_9AGAM|nr:hypothetical protein NEOLEDRAFT_195584 [Neolentinus lepideus HHB14362 ss-1]
MSTPSKDVVVKAARSLRIIALPLTRRPISEVDGHPLVYYHFQMSPKEESAAKPTLLNRMTDKAGSIWAGFGKAEEGSWKLKTFRYGERLMDRIEFEELALKGLDPSLGPKLTIPKNTTSTVMYDADGVKIPLVYPPSYTTTPLLQLQSLIVKRLPRHRQGMWTWILVSPLTAPVALIPIIPNLPFFFCVWRSWHHWRALKASQYLEALLERGSIVSEPSEELDRIYSSHTPKDPSSAYSPPRKTSSESASKPETKNDDDVTDGILLSRDAVPSITSKFDMPPAAAADIYRALAQTSMRIGGYTKS